MFDKNMQTASVAEYKLSDKHLRSSVIEFEKECFSSSIETKSNNEYSSFESILSDSDNHDGDRYYLYGSKNNSTGFYSENGYENYEYSPIWDTYREAYPDQELSEIDPDELRAFWHEKEEAL